ncbi:progesterone-induced-blocking factor 1 isoform X1 [Lampetra fluviatilis]
MSREVTTATSLSLSEFDSEDLLSLESSGPVAAAAEASAAAAAAGPEVRAALQLCRVRLSQSRLAVETLQASRDVQVEELEEKLSDALNEKKLLQARLESQLQLQEEEARVRQERTQREVDAIVTRLREVEERNRELSDRGGALRRGLVDLELTPEQRSALGALPAEQRNLREHMQVLLFDAVHPLREECRKLSELKSRLGGELGACRAEVYSLSQGLEDERRRRGDLETRCQRLLLELEDARQQLALGDHRRDNYDRVKHERDALEQDSEASKRRLQELEMISAAVTKERSELASEVAALRQTVSLLQKDKDYLARKVSELEARSSVESERAERAQAQLELAKHGREEAYEKYLSAREQYKSEYEMRLRDEMDAVRAQTNQEMERLRLNGKEIYERENRSLREARDGAIAERDRARETERQATEKNDALMARLAQGQHVWDTKAAELGGQLKVKTFEAERALLVQEETQRTLGLCQLQCDKFQAKVELLTREFYALQAASERRATELSSQNAELRARVDTYERLEAELDDVVMQSAQMESEEEAERVLFSYGYGANVPTTAKRRLKQSVHLARRILALEKQNTLLRKDLESHQQQAQAIAKELESANSLLSGVQQPHAYLVERLRERDHQLRDLADRAAKLEAQVGDLRKERATLQRTRDHMSADLERLLNQKEELAVMRQVVLALQQRRGAGGGGGDAATVLGGAAALRGARLSAPSVSRAEGPSSPHKPRPTVFVSSHARTATPVHTQAQRWPDPTCTYVELLSRRA